MAARPKPDELCRRSRNQIQHAVGPVQGLEFGCLTHGPGKHACRPTLDDLVVQPAQSIPEPVLQPAVAEFVHLTAVAERVAPKRLQRLEQWLQHAQFQQPWLLQPWGRWRRPFLRRTRALTFNH